MKLNLFIIFFFLQFLLLGCNSEAPLIPIEGTITYKGIPVPKGEIYFDPDANTKGLQGRALINQGKFSTKELNSGISSGKYKIRIHGFDGKPKEEAPMGKAIFPAYEIPLTLVEGQPLMIDVPSK